MKKDISFLESEFLTYLLINYFLSASDFSINNKEYYYQPIKNIILTSDTKEETINIETNDFNACEELYTALKSGKKVKSLNLEVVGKDLKFDFTLKSSPLRITKVNAPKSIAEERFDRILERTLYVDLVFDIFDFWVKKFIEIRVKTFWQDTIINFRDFLEKN
jgi:hypothetical protein